MATLAFVGTDRKVFTPISSALSGLPNGAATVIVFVKRAATTGGADIVGLTDSGPTNWYHTLGLNSSNQGFDDDGLVGVIASSGPAADTTNWWWRAVDWAGGAAGLERFHFRNHTGGGSFTHSDSAANNGGMRAGPGTSGWLRIGSYGDDLGDKSIAIVAIWAGTRFSDSDYGTWTKTSDLANHPLGPPTFLCELTATTLVDLMSGSTFSSGSSSGTTLTGADPDSFTFDGLGGGAVAVPRRQLILPKRLGPRAVGPLFFAPLRTTPADAVTLISGSDSVTASEMSDVQATVPGSDSSTASDTGTVSATVPGSDSATGTDSGTVSATVPGADSATAAESGSVSESGSGSDTGTGSEAGTVFATVTGSDSATATDGQVSIVSPVSGSDSATASETDSTSATGSGSDTGTGSEAASASVTATGSDSAAVADTGSVVVPAAGSDAGTVSEAGTVSATVAGSDSASATEAQNLDTGATPVSGSDSATVTETGSIVDLTPPFVPAPDTGGGGMVDETSIYGDFRALTDSDGAFVWEFGLVDDLTPKPKPVLPKIKWPLRRRREDVRREVADADSATVREAWNVVVLAAGSDSGASIEATVTDDRTVALAERYVQDFEEEWAIFEFLSDE